LSNYVLDHIDGLKECGSLVFHTGEDSGIEIVKLKGYFMVFTIPIYGGEPFFEAAFQTNDKKRLEKFLSSLSDKS